MKINHDAFINLYKTYRKDPLKSLRGRIPDQTDTEGNFRTGTEIFRDEENYLKERLKKDNNIIELDLLKN